MNFEAIGANIYTEIVVFPELSDYDLVCVCRYIHIYTLNIVYINIVYIIIIYITENKLLTKPYAIYVYVT